jgi:CelD/BcsL family acetyltransferase involved in cellulose biosynthesis
LERIDLGRGDDEYKRRAMTGYQLVHQGAITRSRIGFHVAVVRRNAGAAVRDSRIAPVLRRAARASRRRPRVEAAPRPGGTGLSIG